MNTSTEAIKQLQEALTKTQQSADVINNLIAAHDYQDVASLITQAAETLLETAINLMQSDDETAFAKLETTEELLDAVYAIIDGEIDEE